MADLLELLASYDRAKAAWNEADPDGDCDGPEWDACDAAETAVIAAPCLTIEDVRAKARFVLDNGAAYDSVKNCSIGDEDVLQLFLRSLLGKVRP